jgi:hypothetical protein
MFRNGGSCGCYDVCGWGLWGDTHRRTTHDRYFVRADGSLRARPVLIRAALALLFLLALLALLLLLLVLLTLVLLTLVLLTLLAALILLRAVLLTLVLLALVLLIAVCHGSSLPASQMFSDNSGDKRPAPPPFDLIRATEP